MARPTYPDLEMREAGVTRTKVRSTLRSLITSLRPQQWTKNLFVLAALPFGLKLFDPAAVALALAAFVVFCALSGVVYLVNDLYDRDNDRQHQRPGLPSQPRLGTDTGAKLAADGWVRRGVEPNP